MSEPQGPSVQRELRSAITGALKRRDRDAAAVYRAALSAIDNAEAVPADSAPAAGAIESAAVGVGRTDSPRRELSEQDMIEIVLGEAQERRSAAELIDAVRPAAAEQLRSEADLLHAVVHTLAPER